MSIAGAVGVRDDPLMAFNFTVGLLDTSSTLALVQSAALAAVTDVALGGFSACRGLDITLDVEEVREGGRNDAVLKFPTRATWSPIVLERGIGAGTALWDWHYDFVLGQGRRRDGVIALLDDTHLPSHMWWFRRGIPTRYTGPSLDAKESAVAIEALEIQHEGLTQVPNVGLGAAAVGAGITALVTGGL
jgi:phage tail-like protein